MSALPEVTLEVWGLGYHGERRVRPGVALRYMQWCERPSYRRRAWWRPLSSRWRRL